MIEAEEIVYKFIDSQPPDEQSGLRTRAEQGLRSYNEFLLNGDDMFWCNEKLEKMGRYELHLHEVLPMPPLTFVPDADCQNHIGLFAHGFRMSEFDHEGNKIPIRIATLEEILKNDMPDQYRRNLPKNHLARPAYFRALSIVPGPIINLTVEISSREKPLSYYGPELFLAYQAMSRLVDFRDRGAFDKKHGRPNRGYLLTRSVK